MSKEKLKKLRTKFQTPNSNHAITLIALIITIIVMLILVGVTLSITLGDNGLLNKAREATTQTQIAMDSELLLSSVVGAIGNDGKVDFNTLDAQLPNGFEGSRGRYISSNSYEFVVNETGEIIYIENSVENQEDLELLRRYFLGEIDESTGERPGRNPMEVVANPEVFNGGSPMDVKMKSNEIMPNAYNDISVISYVEKYDSNIELFITYNNNYYILAVDIENMLIKSVQTLKISLVDIEGRYYSKWDTTEDFFNEYFEIENNTYTYYKYDYEGETGGYKGYYGDYFIVDYSYNIEGMLLDEENNVIYIMREDEYDFSTRYMYEKVYENDNVVNILLKDLENNYWIFQNYNGIEANLDGIYVENNAEYPDKLSFTKGSHIIQKSKYTDNSNFGLGITEGRLLDDSLYFKYKDTYYTRELENFRYNEYDTMEVSDDLTTIVYGGKTFIKQ